MIKIILTRLIIMPTKPLLCARSCSDCIMCINSFNHTATLMSISQTMKVRYKNWDGNWWNLDLSHRHSDSRDYEEPDKRFGFLLRRQLKASKRFFLVKSYSQIRCFKSPIHTYSAMSIRGDDPEAVWGAQLGKSWGSLDWLVQELQLGHSLQGIYLFISKKH